MTKKELSLKFCVFATAGGAGVQQLLPVHGPVPHHLRADDAVHPGDWPGGRLCVAAPAPGQPRRRLRRPQHHVNPSGTPF